MDKTRVTEGVEEQRTDRFAKMKPLTNGAPSSTETQPSTSSDFLYVSPFTKRSNVWGSSDIWSSRISNGLTPTTGTRDNSGTRENFQRTSPNTVDDVEGKTGSASLVESSVSDEGLQHLPWGTQWSGPPNSVNSGRTMSQAINNESFMSQPRSSSITGLQHTAGIAAQNPSSFAQQSARPPTINLTSTASYHPRSNATSSFSSDVSDRNEQGGPPWGVYTKFPRTSDPPQRKPDSAVSGWFDSSTTPSPSDERRPQGNALYPRNASVPVSREGSMPPSRQSDEPPAFTHPDYARSSRHVTPASSRAPSMSSRNGTFGSLLAPASDPMATQFGKIMLNPDSRPSTSYKSVGGHSSHPSAVSGISSITRSSLQTPASERAKQDYFSDVDRLAMVHRHTDSYSPHAATTPYSDYMGLAQNERYPQNYHGFEVRPNQGFAGSNFQSRPHEFNSMRQPTNSLGTTSRRTANTMDQPLYVDARVHSMMASQLRNQYAMFNQYPVSAMPFNPSSQFVTYGLPNMDVVPTAAQTSMATRDVPSSEAIQSALLCEFKSNANKSKRYELRDIYGHVVEFAGDQYGSRFIQNKLETANSDEKERVFQEVEPNANALMSDIYGNYVIQKLFEHGDQRHKKILANKMRGKVLSLSLQMYGCRVVQKALDHVLIDQQALLVGELENNVIKCVKDQNGNHVIQKAIERCPASSIGFIISAFQGQVQHLSIHPYGCRVIQRCLEKCDPPTNAMILSELMDPIPSMIQDQFGNYVVQHIVCHDKGEAKKRVLAIVARSLETYSKHKFASNVVEKCLERADDHWRRNVLLTLIQNSQARPEEGAVVSMIKDNFGNYVIQKLMDTLNADDYQMFLDVLRPAINAAKRSGCGKQVLAIDKKMNRFPLTPACNGTFNQHGFQAIFRAPFTSNYSSTTTTPPPALTADTRSFQSSRLSSINGDAVEGAPASREGHDIPAANGVQK